MLRSLLGVFVVLPLLAAAPAFADSSPEVRLAERCVAEGEDRAVCECSAREVVIRLSEREVSLLVAVLDAGPRDLQAVVAALAAAGMTPQEMTDVVNRFQAAEPEIRERCGAA